MSVRLGVHLSLFALLASEARDQSRFEKLSSRFTNDLPGAVDKTYVRFS